MLYTEAREITYMPQKGGKLGLVDRLMIEEREFNELLGWSGVEADRRKYGIG